MTRKRWMLVGLLLVVLCVLFGSIAAVYVANNIPGVARLFHDASPEPTAIPIGASEVSAMLATATLTATPTEAVTPTQAATMDPPTSTPTTPPTATALQPSAPTDEAATPTAMATSTSTPPPPPTLTPSPTPVPPTATPKPRWIAFESERGANGDYEIVAMAPDGSGQTNLTNSWADDVAPTWAPDGRRIGFLSFRDTAAGKWGMGAGSIYAMNFDPLTGKSGQVWRVTDDGGHDDWPSWSPDGSRIAFQSDRSGNDDIWIVNVDGSGLAQLTYHPADDRHPNWSPDGKRIAFTSKRSGAEDVWVIDVAKALQGDDAHAINLTKSPHQDRYPFWSPDGRQITFNTNRDGNAEIYLMNADGSGPRNLSQSPKSKEGLADWSPDGQRLVFYSDRSGNKDVYIMDLASLQWTNISKNPASDEFCVWSP